MPINGEVVEFVDNYKFLGMHLNSSLDWSDNAEAIISKGKSRLFLLRRLRSFWRVQQDASDVLPVSYG